MADIQLLQEVVTMVCWDRVWDAAAQRRAAAFRALKGEYERIDREIEALRQAVYSDTKMSSDAMALILGQNITGTVEVRMAVDGHDIEVREEAGVWRVINPNDILTLNRPANTLPLGKPQTVLQNVKQDVNKPTRLALNPSAATAGSILREMDKSSVER